MNFKQQLELLPNTDVQRIFKVLKEATKVLQKGWCKGHEAIDKNGNAVSPLENQAHRFCAVGALARGSNSLGNLTKFERIRIRILAEDLLGTKDVLGSKYKKSHRNIIGFNDEVAHDKRDVVRKFSKATTMVDRYLTKHQQ